MFHIIACTRMQSPAASLDQRKGSASSSFFPDFDACFRVNALALFRTTVAVPSTEQSCQMTRLSMRSSLSLSSRGHVTRVEEDAKEESRCRDRSPGGEEGTGTRDDRR